MASLSFAGFMTPKLCGYLQLGRYAEALRDYEAAIALDPGSSYAHYNAGIAADRRACSLSALCSLPCCVLHLASTLPVVQQAMQQSGATAAHICTSVMLATRIHEHAALCFVC